MPAWPRASCWQDSPRSADHPHTECWDSLSMGCAVGELPTVPTLGMERKPTTGSFPPQFRALQTPSWEPSCPDNSQVSVPAPGAPKSLRKGCVGPAGAGGDPSWARLFLVWCAQPALLGVDAAVLGCEEVSGETAWGRAWRRLKGQAGPQPSAPGLSTFQTEGLTGG